MSQDYFAPASPAEPFRMLRPSSTKSQVIVVAPVSLVWASGGSADAYDPTDGAHASAINAYDTTTTLIDTTQYTWILLAAKGKAYPMLAKEADFATFDSLVGGDWGIWGRVAGGILYRVPQI